MLDKYNSFKTFKLRYKILQEDYLYFIVQFIVTDSSSTDLSL